MSGPCYADVALKAAVGGNSAPIATGSKDITLRCHRGLLLSFICLDYGAYLLRPGEFSNSNR